MSDCLRLWPLVRLLSARHCLDERFALVKIVQIDYMLSNPQSNAFDGCLWLQLYFVPVE